MEGWMAADCGLKTVAPMLTSPDRDASLRFATEDCRLKTVDCRLKTEDWMPALIFKKWNGLK